MSTNRWNARRSRSQIDPRLLIAVGGGVVIVVAALLVYVITRDDGSPSKREAPTFTLASPTGGGISLTDYRGQYVLVNFWATWCQPCDSEMPALQDYHHAHRDQGFTLLAVNVTEDSATVNSYLLSRGFRFPVGLDTTGSVYDRFGVDALPTSYLIDPEGYIIKEWTQEVSRAFLEREITPLLGG